MICAMFVLQGGSSGQYSKLLEKFGPPQILESIRYSKLENPNYSYSLFESWGIETEYNYSKKN